MSRVPFSARLLLGLLVLQLLLFGSLLWNGGRLLEASHNELWRQVAQEHGALLARALAPAIALNNRPALLQTLELLRDNSSLHYAAVFNTQRQLLATLGEPPPLAQRLSTTFQYRLGLEDGLLAVEQPILLDNQTLGLLQLGYQNQPLNRLLMEAAYQNLAILLAGLALVGLFSLIVGRSLQQGLRRLQAGLAALQHGELAQRLSSDAVGITAEVERAYNALAAQLQVNHAELCGQHESLRQELRRLNNLLHGINAVVWEVDPGTGQFRYVSDDVEPLLGYPPAAWLEADFCQHHVHHNDLDWVQGFLTHTGVTSDNFTLDFRLYNQANALRWLRLISTVELRPQGTVLAGLLLDVTDQKLSEQRIAYLADHDALTGLINRRRFQEKLEELIAYNRRYHVNGALLFLDLDQFKYINDTFGHQIGDQYLRQVAQHLRDSLRQTDVVSRLGGDEFGVIMPNVGNTRTELLGESLLKMLNNNEFVHEDQRIAFNASIGIALFPAHGDNPSDLLARADAAMYAAKKQGRNTYCIFQEGTNVTEMQDKIHWEERIRHALKENRFQLYFQPIVDIHDGNISHYESLLRMLAKDGKVIPPGAFLGIAERFGLIREIDCWVVENAIRTQAESIQAGKPVALTINLSGRHFGNPRILQVIQEATKQYKADPRNIVFEVTETAAVENFAEACDFIKALREMRYRFALDDFGAGFSSFDYLKHIPVDYVKIDGSFVRNLTREKVDRIFVKAIADMAHGVKVKTIAEFVEDMATVEVLRELGVDMGQGYFFAKPAPNFPEVNPAFIRQADA